VPPTHDDFVHAIFQLHMGWGLGRIYGDASSTSCLAALFLVMVWLRLARRSLSFVSHDECAKARYGKLMSILDA
jgi:hypothetical protein